jgi:predicted polyphosphate/ATP-dependent NAD kinase
MGKIAIIVNPNSGKDIRRLVTHATIFDNAEKINILRRIISTIYAFGRHRVFIIPDRSYLGERALDGLKLPDLASMVTVPQMRVTDKQGDTVLFTERMVREEKVDAVIVMGGDGTCRAAAKAIEDVPLIPISTGTNNVYPEMYEGTISGMAAAAIASGSVKSSECGRRGKRIEINVFRSSDVGKSGSNSESKPGPEPEPEPKSEQELKFQDIALIDVAFSTKVYTGARALLEEKDIKAILVAQAHPASIGFSALAGSVKIVKPEDDFGLYARFDWEKDIYTAAMSAGYITRFGVLEEKKISLGENFEITPGYMGTIAVDGEREIVFRADDKITACITRNGPRKVDVVKVVETAWGRGFFG